MLQNPSLLSFSRRRPADFRLVLLQQFRQLLPGVVHAGALFDFLPQEFVHTVEHVDGGIDLFIAPAAIGPDGNQIFLFAIDRQQLAHRPGGAEMFRIDHVGHQTAEAFEHVDRRVMRPRSEPPREPRMPVDQSADGVGDRLVRIVGLDENRVERGDAPFRAAAGALDQLRQDGEHRGRKSARGGRLAGGQADLPLRKRETSQRIHHQHHVFALVAEILGDGRGRLRRLRAEDRRLVARGDDHDAAGESRGAEIALDEFVDLAAALADQRNHVHVGIGIAGHHAQQNALSHAGAGEDAHPLPFAAGDESVHRANARGKRLVDSRPRAGVRRIAVDRGALGEDGLRFLIDGDALGVEHPPQHGLPDPQPARGPRQPDAVAAPHAAHVGKGIQERQLVAEADDLGQQRRAGLALDFGHGADRRGKARRGDGHSDRPRHAASKRGRHHAFELFGDVEHF